MIDTSKDVLLLVSSLAIAAFTFFLCWALYLLIKMLRVGNEAVQKIKEKVESIGETIETVKEKLTKTSGSVKTIANAVSGIIKYVQKKKDKKEKKEEE
ncbi:MAG: hypothetical protein U5L76_02790 [Patescibacteria group bacterium]|nr:hypothetical protein [Patescibacteria group bacterium]